MSRIYATYFVESSEDIARVAEAIAGEQSSGTFITLPHESEELKRRSRAVVESIEIIGEVNQPSLPIARKIKSEKYTQAVIKLSWNFENMGASLQNILATVTGNLFELSQCSALRLLDLFLPQEFADKYQGPAFGIEGTRELSGVYGRPLIGTIIKPSVGLNPNETALIVKELVETNIDFIKDDELQGDGSHCPFEARVDSVMKVIDAHAQKTGKKVMYAFNITGDIDEMKFRHDKVLKAGGTCVMMSMHSVGLSGFIEIRKHSKLPIHAHRNGWGLYSRSPHIGVEYTPWQKIWRLAGADHLHVNGIDNKFCEESKSSIKSAKSILAPLYKEKPYIGMPVFSSGQSAVQIDRTYKELNSVDLIYAAGGGIMGHKSGIKAGVDSLKQAWDAAIKGINVDEYAKNHQALQEALKTYR